MVDGKFNYKLKITVKRIKKMIFTKKISKKLIIWNSLLRREVEYKGHLCNILSLSINSAGDTIASGDENGKIILWDENLKFLHHFNEHKKAVNGKNYN